MYPCRHLFTLRRISPGMHTMVNIYDREGLTILPAEKLVCIFKITGRCDLSKGSSGLHEAALQDVSATQSTCRH